MKEPNEPNVTFSTDSEGNRVVLVPVNGSPKPALVSPEDWERLKREKLATGWAVNHTGNGHWYVRLGRWTQFGPGRRETIARLIMRPAIGQCVKYRDGSPLNLTRANLYFGSDSHAGKAAAKRAAAQGEGFGEERVAA